MIAVLVGLVFIVLGFFGIVRWFPDFLVVMKGFLPVSILIGGLIALITGIASFKSPRLDDDSKK